MRRLLLLIALALPFGSLECHPHGLFVFAVSLQSSVRTLERFEILATIDPAAPNPFDPSQIRARGEFLAPDGGMHVMPAFYGNDYSRSLEGGYERLTLIGREFWRVRFAPTMEGEWSWRLVAEMPSGSAASPWSSFTAEPPAPDEHGFLHVSPDDPRYLRFDDGTPYFAIGENLCWYDGRGTFAYDDWFAKLSAEGVNYARLWMPSWAFGLEWIGRGASGEVVWSSLGDYTQRLDRAWQLDQVIEAAEDHGIYLMLSIQNHGPFSLTANSEWADNPYNAANGGPLTEPRELFTDPDARELFRRRLRYIVARWGYSTHILAWELWNEVDLVAPDHSPEVLAWHQQMSQELRDLDPYDHLVTTSVSSTPHSPLFDLAEIELQQVHFYSHPFDFDLSLLLPVMAGQEPGATKPRLLGEVGVDWRGPAETVAKDPEAIGFHDGLWATTVAGSMGTGMTWWWDNVIDPEDLYFHFGPVARFVEGVAFDREGFASLETTASAAGRNLRARAMQGSHVVLAWLRNVDHQWFPPETGLDPEPVVGARLALTGIADGEWTARWIDTYTGADLAMEPATASGGSLLLDVPIFSKDVALRLDR